MIRRLLRFVNKVFGLMVINSIYSIGKICRSKFFRNAEDISIRNILIVKIVGIGDTVLMIPNLKKIKKTYENTKIVALLTPLSSGILFDQPLIDEVIIYDILGEHRGILGFMGIISSLRKKKIDVVVDFEQHIKLITVISFLTGAKKIIGFNNDTIKRGRLLTDQVTLTGDKHMFESYNDLLKPLGIQSYNGKPERIWMSPSDSNYVEEWLNRNNVISDDIMVGIHVGSSERAKARRWPMDRFAELADRIIEIQKAKVVLTGTYSETPLIKDVVQCMKYKPLIAAGHMNLKQLAALIDRMTLFISNDTGPLHISAAMGTTTIGLFGPNDPVRYRPYGSDNYAIYKNLPCSPCINIHAGKVPKCKNSKYMECMERITVDDVWEVVDSVINQ
jgi:heptosyltransferase-2